MSRKMKKDQWNCTSIITIVHPAGDPLDFPAVSLCIGHHGERQPRATVVMNVESVHGLMAQLVECLDQLGEPLDDPVVTLRRID